MSLFATTSSRFAARLRPFSGVRLPVGVTPLALAIAVGVVDGFSSIALKELAEGFEDLFVGELGTAITDAAGDWAILFVPVIVIVPIIWLITRFAPETRGHGVPEVMRSVETQGGRVPRRTPIIKGIASALTISGGASGGVLAPSLFIGAMLGGLFGIAFVELAPDSVAPTGAYAVVGMAAVFAAAARAPITSLFIVFELTRDYSLILPLMTAVAIATAVAQIITRDTICSIKLSRIGVDVTDELRRSLVAELTVAETMSTNVPLVNEDASLEELALAISRSRGTVLAVTDERVDAFRA